VINTLGMPEGINLEKTSFKPAETILGAVSLDLTKGEFLPASTSIDVSIEGANYSKSMSLTLKEFFELSNAALEQTEGSFYSTRAALSGNGEGFGIEGLKTDAPDVDFELKLIPKQIAAEIVSNETPAQLPTETPPAETPPAETPAEEQPPAEQQAGVEPALSSPEPAEIPAETPPAETPAPSVTGAIIGITGKAINSITEETEVSGSCNADNKFNLMIGDADVSLVPGSVKVGNETLDDSVLKIKVENGEVTVSTDYIEEEKGFGMDYLTNETERIDLDIEKLNISIPEDGDYKLKVSLGYEGTQIERFEQDISVNSSIEAVEYQTMEDDPSFDAIIDSAEYDNETKQLAVVFHHDANKRMPVSIAFNETPIDYSFSRLIADKGESVTLTVNDWTEEKYFEIKVGEHSEIIGFGTAPYYYFYAGIEDNQGKKLGRTVKFTQNGNLKGQLETTELTDQAGKGTYKIEVDLQETPVKKVTFNGFNINKNVTKFIKIKNESVSGYVNSYAIDPTDLDFSQFTSLTFTATASGNALYKCKNWNFTTETCVDGNWTKVQNLIPGENYTITLAASDPGFAETLQPGATTGEDSYIISSAPNTNNGDGINLQLTADARRILIEFNLSGIPSNARITSANLKLYVTAKGSGDPVTNVYRLTQSWTESGVTWNKYDGTNNWATAGGDYDSTVWATATVTASGWSTWNVGNLIQSWVNGSYSNYGMLAGTSTASGTTYFASSDNSDTSLWPVLEINYTTPLNISFVSPTPNNASTMNASSVYVNVSLTNGNASSAKLEWMNGGNTNYTMSNYTRSNWYYNVTGLTSGTYTYKVYANDSFDGSVYASDLRTVIVSACAANMTNTTWSGWSNLSCSGTQMNQSRTRVQYDSNNCGTVNATIYDYQLVGPTYANTSWSGWTNISCLSNDKMNQSRNLTQYDAYSCAANSTITEYRQTETCDFCTPNLVNTSWSAWINVSCSGENMNQSRFLTQYDSNNCNEISNQTIYSYQLAGPNLANTTWTGWINLSCSGSQINQSSNLTQYDGYGCKANETIFRYQLVGPAYANTSWSAWINITACMPGDYYTQSRNLTQYDNYACAANSTIYGYQNLSCTYNRNPVVTNPSISPSTAYTGNDLTCSFTVTDEDSGETLTANYTWYNGTNAVISGSMSVINGTESSIILGNGNTTKNEIWNCSIKPYDTKDYGTEKSAARTISNSLPSAPVIDILPGSPGDNEDLVSTIAAASTDLDNDSITYSYQWYKNDVLQAGQTANTLSKLLTSIGENWKCVVTPNDGTVNGATGSDNVTIVSSDTTAPTITIVNPANGGSLSTGTTSTYINITTNENAVCRYNTTNSAFSFSEGINFTTTGNSAHSFLFSGLSNGQSYTLYYKCNDTSGNINSASTTHTFSVLAAPYCGDGSCNNGETCSSCSADCGSCSGGGSHGGGGGGGGSIIKTNNTVNVNYTQNPLQNLACAENWRCGEWTECTIEGIQVRACSDLNKCGTSVSKPAEIQSCQRPTCFDGIQNQEELGIDCGGPCAKRCGVAEIAGSVLKVPSPEKNEKSKYGILLISLLFVLVGMLIMISKTEYRMKGHIRNSHILTHLHEHHHGTQVSPKASHIKDINKARFKLLLMNIAHIIIIIIIIGVIYYLLR
jgi:hypothetical protein